MLVSDDLRSPESEEAEMRRAVAGVLVLWLFVGSGAVAEMTADEMRALEEASGRSAEAELAPEAPSARAVERAKDLYGKGEYALAAEQLMVARQENPNDPEAALLLGLAELRRNDPGKAAAAWAEFVEETPDRKLAGDVARYRTILLDEANHRAAKEALANEQQLVRQPTGAKTVAVSAFRNAGSAEYAPLGKAFAAMLIDNLQGVPGITVLEREQVQALAEEAALSKSGLVEERTAVRAGKLLRAGTVAAGSHIDWTKSPTHLRVEAVLVDVDRAAQLAQESEERLVDRFYEIVPGISSRFVPVLTGRSLRELPPPAVARTLEEHTHSLPAVLAFGDVLEARDRKDGESAQKACRRVEQHDPNFRLARRTCAVIPPLWMSQEAVAAAVEAQVLVAPASLASQVAPWVIGAAVVGGAVAGGVVAAGGGDGDGDGGGGGNGGGQNNPPGISGVPSNSTVAGGTELSFDVNGNDPDGDSVTLTNQNPPPGSTFNQTSGALVRGHFEWVPACEQVGTYQTRFCATDGRGGQSCGDARIEVTRCVPPPPTCDGLGTLCETAGQCCSNTCDFNNEQSDFEVCCIALGGNCANAPNDCCVAADGGTECSGPGSTCCITQGGFGCSQDEDCCPGSICYGGSCFGDLG